MLFKNATIYTMEQDPFVGDFRIDKGVFTEIGKDLNPKDEEVQDLNGLYVFPGLIDAHSHLVWYVLPLVLKAKMEMKSQIQLRPIFVASMAVIQWMKQLKKH